jgi:hypothetical protein
VERAPRPAAVSGAAVAQGGEGELAFTGADLSALVLLALALAVVGAGLTYLGTRAAGRQTSR